MRQVLNLAWTLKMKSISTLTWSCFITEKPVHLQNAFEKAESTTMTWKILKVSHKSPYCESPKYELKGWCFLVLRIYWKGGDCPYLLSLWPRKLILLTCRFGTLQIYFAESCLVFHPCSPSVNEILAQVWPWYWRLLMP